VIAQDYPSEVDIHIQESARHNGMIQALDGGLVSIQSPSLKTPFNAAQAINEDAGQYFSTGSGSRININDMLMIGGCFMADGGDVQAIRSEFQDTVIRIGTYQADAGTSYENLYTEGANSIVNSTVVNYGNITVPGTLSVLKGKSFVNHGAVIVPRGGSLNIERLSLDLVRENGLTETVYRPGTANALTDVLIGGNWDIAGTLNIEQATFRKIGAAPAQSYSGSTYIDGDGVSRQAVAAVDNAEQLSYGKPASLTLRGPNWNFPAIESLEYNQGRFLLLEGSTFNSAANFYNLGFNYIEGSTLNVNGVYTQMGDLSSTYVLGDGALNVPSHEYVIIGGNVKSSFASQIFGRNGNQTVLDSVKLRIEGLPTHGIGNREPNPVEINLSIDSQPGNPDTFAKIKRIGPGAEMLLHGFVEFDALLYLEENDGRLVFSGSGLANHGEFSILPNFVNRGELSLLGHATELETYEFLQQSGRTTVGPGAMLKNNHGFDASGGEVIFEIGERRPSRGEPHIGAQETNGMIQTGGGYCKLGGLRSCEVHQGIFTSNR